jgi:tetratricopeptide (TPR) repeat protein
MEVNTGIMGNSLTTYGNILSALTIILTVIISVGGIVGFLEIRRWRSLRKGMERTKQEVDKIKKRFDNTLAEADKRVAELGKPLQSVQLINDMSASIKAKFDEYDRALETAQILGKQLSPQDYVLRGNAEFSKNNYESAIAAYDKAISLKPDYALAWNNKGLALTEMSRKEEALAAFEKAIAIKPAYFPAWSNKGCSLTRFKLYEEALVAFEKAIALKPDDTKTYFNRACTFALMKRKSESLADLKRAIDLDQKYKATAKIDKDFEDFRNDPDFLRLVE